MGTPVLDRDLARQITKGRTPLVPLEYETAVKSLAACTTLDESKYWADKADALAAWAKIYHSREAELKAKQLKLHAYRRMGELAQDLRPSKVGRPRNDQERSTADDLLRSHGLSITGSRAARRLAHIPQRQFDKLLKEPQAPTTIVNNMYAKYPEWREFSRAAMQMRSFCRRYPAASFAKLCREAGPSYSATLTACLTEISEWSDQVDRLVKRK